MSAATDPHIPVLFQPLVRAVAPVAGIWLDGTFGAGGYARGLMAAGADRVIGLDRDPMVLEMAAAWLADFGGKIELHRDTFDNLDQYGPLDGVVLDLGVSSMQLDEGGRGFSFMRDGPLDMRMGQEGTSAADLVNGLSEQALADVIYGFGEERASRRIARVIVARRPVETTGALAEIVEGCLPRARPGQSHPATRTFQALRIAVNDELGQLVDGLEAAERALRPGGGLAVVTFHSVEDRIVKRYLAARSGRAGGGSRHAPEVAQAAPAFEAITRKAIEADAAERARNPRSRSARLRVARRTDAPAGVVDRAGLGLPNVTLKGMGM